MNADNKRLDAALRNTTLDSEVAAQLATVRDAIEELYARQKAYNDHNTELKLARIGDAYETGQISWDEYKTRMNDAWGKYFKDGNNAYDIRNRANEVYNDLHQYYQIGR